MWDKIITIGLLLCSLQPFPALADEFDHQHELWHNILSRHVSVDGPASRVDYRAIKRNIKPLEQYLTALSAVRKQAFQSWSKPRRLAFLINAYNAFTVKLVLDHYPVASIKDIGNFFRSSWKIEFFKLLGEDMHLDHIEHTLIRGARDFNEPRIHFALVCASMGCPKLHNGAYTADNLEQLLDQGAREFLQDRQRNRYNAQEKTLYLSKIFKWYEEDFVKSHGSVAAFVMPYMGLEEAQQFEIDYLDYDWALNDRVKE